MKYYALDVPQPIAQVWHYTAGQGDGNEEYDFDHPDHALAALVDRVASRGGRQVSAHDWIAKDGTIFQSVSYLKGAWHVGRGGDVGGRHWGNVNRCTVGTEMENAGRLKSINDRWYCWPYRIAGQLTPSPNCLISDDRAGHAEFGGVFDKFTAEQEESATRLLQAKVEAYGWDRAACSYGHVDFDSQNREDPGPLWRDEVLPRILAAVFGEAP
jgi:N-acetyl-anhydromuramyl-L-alanine amidase AmpD